MTGLCLVSFLFYLHDGTMMQHLSSTHNPAFGKFNLDFTRPDLLVKVTGGKMCYSGMGWGGV